MKRSRINYAIMAAAVIVSGCFSRSEIFAWLPPIATKCAGDVLWALMIYLGLGFLLPRLKVSALAITVLVLSFGVEFSQLYHAQWLDAFRRTFLGAVMLGSGFHWPDLVCYAAGCGIGVMIDRHISG